jgi:UDP-N-acetylmuramyl pentapeptide phosphotransferase/UDP-N-acetylglucosamine-1-phosphate transferase
VPILPLIDLLLLLGTGSLFVGFLLKAISITTRFHPNVLGFTSIDFVLIAGVCMGLALVLAARTWVKLHEPRLLAMRRRVLEETFRREQIELEREAAGLDGEVELLVPPSSPARRGAAGERH